MIENSFFLTWNSSMRNTDKHTTAKDIEITGIVTKYLENIFITSYYRQLSADIKMKN